MRVLGSRDCVTSANVLATPPPTPPASTPNTQPDPGELPATGGSSNDLLQIVLLLGLSGLTLVLISRRRRRATS
jgi:LPXTG-motif cell wall-anchored protein